MAEVMTSKTPMTKEERRLKEKEEKKIKLQERLELRKKKKEVKKLAKQILAENLQKKQPDILPSQQLVAKYVKTKKLLLLDLNQVLMYRHKLIKGGSKYTNDIIVDDRVIHNFYVDENTDYPSHVYLRPGIRKLFNHIFNQYDVGVFTSMMPQNVAKVIEHVFRSHKPKIKFVLSRAFCDIDPNGAEAHDTIKRIEKIFPHKTINPECLYTRSGTVIIDDSISKSRENIENAIIVKPFDIDAITKHIATHTDCLVPGVENSQKNHKMLCANEMEEGFTNIIRDVVTKFKELEEANFPAPHPDVLQKNISDLILPMISKYSFENITINISRQSNADVPEIKVKVDKHTVTEPSESSKQILTPNDNQPQSDPVPVEGSPAVQSSTTSESPPENVRW
jgi:hypothetical protein